METFYMTKRLVTLFVKNSNQFNIMQLSPWQTLQEEASEKNFLRTRLRIPTPTTVIEDTLFLFQNNKKNNLPSTSLN